MTYHYIPCPRNSICQPISAGIAFSENLSDPALTNPYKLINAST